MTSVAVRGSSAASVRRWFGRRAPARRKRVAGIVALACSFFFLPGCRPEVMPLGATSAEVSSPPPLAQITATVSPTRAAVQLVESPESISLAPSTPTTVPTSTSSPTPIPTSTPTATETPVPTPTATPIGACEQRDPGDDLLALVTRSYGLSRDFAPNDLVPISDYFSSRITLGYPTELRQVVIEPLVTMINDMLAAGLNPLIISGYRSYSAQAIAWNKWLRQTPETASIVSAPPGFSEHQLGTTIDFGSPELAEIIGREDLQFHTYFYKTRESQWLAEHAHEYGFTLSYPREAFDLTGFYYEPWHYRFVGREIATLLKGQGIFLVQYLIDTRPLPCEP